mmetsp:Transcript_110536/g.323397  ORF Transcript_110536/g.323397 Transcript_110536/m.323397 type:complete len:549 (-) Transcript_110536:52-1698(-)
MRLGPVAEELDEQGEQHGVRKQEEVGRHVVRHLAEEVPERRRQRVRRDGDARLVQQADELVQAGGERRGRHQAEREEEEQEPEEPQHDQAPVPLHVQVLPDDVGGRGRPLAPQRHGRPGRHAELEERVRVPLHVLRQHVQAPRAAEPLRLLQQQGRVDAPGHDREGVAGQALLRLRRPEAARGRHAVVLPAEPPRELPREAPAPGGPQVRRVKHVHGEDLLLLQEAAPLVPAQLQEGLLGEEQALHPLLQGLLQVLRDPLYLVLAEQEGLPILPVLAGQLRQPHPALHEGRLLHVGEPAQQPAREDQGREAVDDGQREFHVARDEVHVLLTVHKVLERRHVLQRRLEEPALAGILIPCKHWDVAVQRQLLAFLQGDSLHEAACRSGVSGQRCVERPRAVATRAVCNHVLVGPREAGVAVLAGAEGGPPDVLHGLSVQQGVEVPHCRGGDRGDQPQHQEEPEACVQEGQVVRGRHAQAGTGPRRRRQQRGVAGIDCPEVAPALQVLLARVAQVAEEEEAAVGGSCDDQAIAERLLKCLVEPCPNPGGSH